MKWKRKIKEKEIKHPGWISTPIEPPSNSGFLGESTVPSLFLVVKRFTREKKVLKTCGNLQ